MRAVVEQLRRKMPFGDALSWRTCRTGAPASRQAEQLGYPALCIRIVAGAPGRVIERLLHVDDQQRWRRSSLLGSFGHPG